jgi:hypothetical protein
MDSSVGCFHWFIPWQYILTFGTVGFGVPAECLELPAHMELINETYILPDPFKFIDGQPTKTKAD